jgi:hypothetical protein
MNLQVNLIHKSEQRSGSVVSLKSLVRIGGVVIPIVILLAIGMSFVKFMVLQSELKILEDEWLDAEPKKAEALSLADQLRDNRNLFEELQGWRESHLDWHVHLAKIQSLVPPTMQLRSLAVNQVIQLLETAVPARVFTAKIAGRCQGRNAESDIEFFKRQVERVPPLVDDIATVIVTGYGEDRSEGAGEFDRVFQIDCNYRPRSFDETAGR